MKLEIIEEQYAFLSRMGFDMSDYVTCSGRDECVPCTCRDCQTCMKDEQKKGVA